MHSSWSCFPVWTRNENKFSGPWSLCAVLLQRKHDKVYQWKALRMISRESLPIFARTALNSNLEEVRDDEHLRSSADDPTLLAHGIQCFWTLEALPLHFDLRGKLSSLA